ncbi:MAG: metallophosphoesterase [Ignavibacteriae bacterium]|nr:metallophosphoesterase [Ignavibacteriota bacterium]
MTFLLFFLIWFVLLALTYWYVGRRLIRPANLKAKRRNLAWLGVVLLFIIPQVPFLLLVNRIESWWTDILAWFGYFSLGLFTLILASVFARDVVLLIVRGGKAVWETLDRLPKTPDPVVDRERRRFLVHATNLGILGVSAAATGYGYYEARRRALVEHVDVPITNLPHEFDGFRIAQFTDIHVGPTIKRDVVEEIANQIHELNTDLIVFTGDLVDGSVPWLQDDVAPLRELAAPYGRFFITGNHEYYSGAKPWVKHASSLGFDVLLNEHRIIERSESRIVLAGVTDYSGGDFLPEHRSDPAKAVADAPEELIKILLAHQPRSVYAAETAGIDLQLSGHTHGGQFYPGNYLVTLNQPYIKGLHKHGNMWVYVSRGTGYWGPPLRIGIPPEITVIVLRSAEVESQRSDVHARPLTPYEKRGA